MLKDVLRGPGALTTTSHQAHWRVQVEEFSLKVVIFAVAPILIDSMSSSSGRVCYTKIRLHWLKNTQCIVPLTKES